MFKKIRLALLYGGISNEREVSLNTGKMIARALDKKKYKVIFYDTAHDLKKLVEDISKYKIDIAFIALHGLFGEDGTVQGLLELFKVPYIGSGVLGSAISMNKEIAKQLYQMNRIPTPEFIVLNKKNKNIHKNKIIKKFNLPCVVKPVESGSSIGIGIPQTKQEFKKACNLAFKFDSKIMIERFIKGREITGAVIGNDVLQALPIIEIIPKVSNFFNYEAKYTSGASEEVCPAKISKKITKQAQDLAIRAHRALKCRGMSRTDMILDRKGKLYVLETNTIPGMTKTSLLPQAAKEAGIAFPKLLDKLIKLAKA